MRSSTYISSRAMWLDGDLERAAVYGVLARCLSYPDMEMVEALVGGLSGSLSDLLGALGGDGDATMQATVSWLEGRGADRESLLRDLSPDYTRLFITGMPRAAAPPYESVYVDRGLLMGESVSKVLAAYREAGLEISEDYTDLPDHLVAELGFMQKLANAQHEASTAGEYATAARWRDRQRRFLAEHLARWAPLCLDRVVDGASTPFYRALAEVCQRFVDWDHSRLATPPAEMSTEDE